MKSLISLAVVLIALVGGFFILNNYIYQEKQATTAADFKDAEYLIDGERIQLTDGVAETPSAPGSASMVTTRYFGNEIRRDVNGDGVDDIIFLLTQSTGGSGTFYYVVGAVSTPDGYVGSQAYLLGDRIAPQTTEWSQNPSHQNVIVVNFAERKPGEPMTADPSVGKSVWLKFDPTALQFGEVVQNFEGEADPSRMTLGMKTWVWQGALYNDGTQVVPKQAGKFTLTLGNDAKFTATTDCNSMGGSYFTTKGGYEIVFKDIYSTKMYCEGSQENVFSKLLADSTGYLFTSKGELVLDLKFDSGTVTFR